MIKQTLTLALLAVATTLVNVLFQWYVITHLGVGIETDALFAGMAVPQFILLVMSSTLPPVLVPILAAEDQSTFRQNALLLNLAIQIFLLEGFVIPKRLRNS